MTPPRDCPRGLAGWCDEGQERCWKRGADWLCGWQTPPPGDTITTVYAVKRKGENDDR